MGDRKMKSSPGSVLSNDVARTAVDSAMRGTEPQLTSPFNTETFAQARGERRERRDCELIPSFPFIQILLFKSYCSNRELGLYQSINDKHPVGALASTGCCV